MKSVVRSSALIKQLLIGNLFLKYRNDNISLIFHDLGCNASRCQLQKVSYSSADISVPSMPSTSFQPQPYTVNPYRSKDYDWIDILIILN